MPSPPRLARVLLAFLVAGCAGPFDEARVREARAAEVERRSGDARAAGARAMADLPVCAEAEVPEGAERVEGVVVRPTGFVGTDALCPVTNPCCNGATFELALRPDDGHGAPAPIPVDGDRVAPFGPHSLGLLECDMGPWLDGFGLPRLRLTWFPSSPGRSSRVVELCRVEPPG